MLNFWGPKKRQKGKNCNHDSSYHTTAVGECLVDVWFAEICQLNLCIFESQSVLSKSTGLLYGSTASCRFIQCCMYSWTAVQDSTTSWYSKLTAFIRNGTPMLIGSKFLFHQVYSLQSLRLKALNYLFMLTVFQQIQTKFGLILLTVLLIWH